MRRLARDLTRGESYSEAIAVWQEIEQNYGESAESRLAISRLHAKLADWDNAYKASASGLNIHPPNCKHPLLKIHGQAAIKLGNYPSAVQAYSAIAAVDPEATLVAAKQLMARKQHTFAGHLLAIVLLDHPDHSQALSLKPELLAILDQMRQDSTRTPRELAGICRIILVIDSDFRTAEKQLRSLRSNALQQARAALDVGDLNAAKQAFNTVLDCNPQDSAALRGLVAIDKEREDWDAVAGHWERISIAKGHPERVVIAHTRALEKAGRTAEAIKVLQRLPVSTLTDPKIHALIVRSSSKALQLAKNKLTNNENTAALEIITSVKALVPDHPRAERYEKLALAQGRRQVQEYARKSSHAKIIIYAQAILNYSKNDLGLLRRLCQSYAKLRLYAEGHPWFKLLAEKEPDQASHWLRYAISCRAIADEDEALNAARRVIALAPDNGSATRLIEATLQRQLQQQAMETASAQQKI